VQNSKEKINGENVRKILRHTHHGKWVSDLDIGEFKIAGLEKAAILDIGGLR